MPWLLFPLYAAACGTILTVAEDRRYLMGMFVRPDVRGYLLARSAMVAAMGMLPFLLARVST